MGNRRKSSPDAPGGAMGDVFEELAEEEHLTPRQLEAAAFFLRHLRADHGSSAGLVSQVSSDKVDSSIRQPPWPPGGGKHVGILDAMLKDLHLHERELLAFLVRHRELPRGSLADWGRMHSAYKTNKTRRAFAVGRITAFLDSLAEVCLPSVDSS